MTQGFTNNAPVYTGYTAPTQQIFTSGSGTYTTPAGVLFITVEMVGAGGGGGGGGTGGGVGGAGGSTTFGTALLQIIGGSAGAGSSNSTSSAGGVPTGGDINIIGGSGGGGAAGATAIGGLGGSSPIGGLSINSFNATPPPQSFSGGGGNGGAANGAGTGGTGGGGGGYLRKQINSPAASYSYAVGAAGTLGTAGTSGVAGAAGAAGIIIVTEYYQLNTYGELLTFTGTGDVVKGTSPTITTPNTVGVTNASNASAGSVGEYQNDTATSVTCAANASTNVVTLSLTAGDWDVYGTVNVGSSATTQTAVYAWISTSSATFPGGVLTTYIEATAGSIPAPFKRISISSTTTVYLSTYITAASGNASCNGATYARRVR